MAELISIAVVDDHPLFREGVTRSLSETGRFTVVAEGSSRDDAVKIASDKAPDLMLIDLSMPGGGINALQPIVDARPHIRLVVLTVSEAAEDVADALNAGVKGYVLKGVGSRALIEILLAVAAGEIYVTPSLSAKLLSHVATRQSPIAASIQRLSVRELEVLRLIADGKSNKEVAIALNLQEKTIKHHVSRILSKLKANNRTEAAIKYHAATGARARSG